MEGLKEVKVGIAILGVVILIQPPDHRGHVLDVGSLSLVIRLSILFWTILIIFHRNNEMRTAWDTADSLTLNCSPIVLRRSDVYL